WRVADPPDPTTALDDDPRRGGHGNATEADLPLAHGFAQGRARAAPAAAPRRPPGAGRRQARRRPHAARRVPVRTGEAGPGSCSAGRHRRPPELHGGRGHRLVTVAARLHTVEEARAAILAAVG